MHPKNPHKGRYDFSTLCRITPELKAHIKPNPKGDKSIDFSDPAAVLCLNKALLASVYKIHFWQIPQGYLCPPIPGRADYIFHLADLLADSAQGAAKEKVKALDIGTGANLIYPIIGSQSQGWQYLATDIDPVSVKTATAIVNANPGLKKRVKVVLQKNKQHIFHGVIQPEDYFHVTMCNPPFHASLKEAQAGTERKWRNLKGKTGRTLNFGGQKAELWCPGGEIRFLKQMAVESKDYANQVGWFTSLVSKKDNVRPLIKQLETLKVKEHKVVKMSQGQKISRFVAWRFC